ncbi:S-adenosyl-L-methionine-dependent methyltransferase [Venustampulla echinocandica]|uniref:S-adenosyl-L-methionine-dependent methyltransferase n=1 Tax=Venustampulla echinocandica TaxID=2656787 RepID=A0A370TJQ6_9HELO|nr:S-adenosyl-L-methionine-dependent methyltransferase [Venustampulla echinocandica]RDL35761.1 S-adenosyl-L-methionine-dependent methyltransferase [Venustampulla echinocandica]
MSVYKEPNEPVALIKALSQLSLTLSSEDNQNVKREALRLSQALTAALQAPEDIAVNMSFAAFTPMSVRIAVGLKLFQHIVSRGPITTVELASVSGGDDLLITRILRTLSAAGFVKEVDDQAWAATAVTKAMTIQGIAEAHIFMWDMLVVAAGKAPKFLEETGYQNPTNSRDGLLQYGHQTKLTIFELMSTMPQMQRDFDDFMVRLMGANESWVDWYPIQEQVIHGARDNSALVVDVGGGKGHDLQAFNMKYPQQGRLVLQDRPPVIDGIKDLHPAIEYVKHDFFTSQPIQGARVYFYHHILHDWPDSKCLVILQQAKRAMIPGYSKLLLHEHILPEKGASTVQTQFDMAVMLFNSGTLRTPKHWGQLLDKAGLKLVKVWFKEAATDNEGVVEAVVEEN